MRIFIIDNEELLCRHLAAKTWTRDFVTESDKVLQEKMRIQNKKESEDRFWKTMNEIQARKNKTGQSGPIARKKMLADKFSETVVCI